jgi:hypothetical protein
MADHAVLPHAPEPEPVDLDALLARPRPEKQLVGRIRRGDVLLYPPLHCLDCGRPLVRHTNPHGGPHRDLGPYGLLWTCAEMDQFDRNAARRDARHRRRPVALLRRAWSWAVAR